MIWFVLASMAVMAMYVAAVILREGITYSISATYYKLERPGWFSGCVAASGVLVLPPVLELGDPYWSFLGFIGVGGMLFVAFAPNFKEELEGKVHMASAVCCVTGSQLWVLANMPWILIAWAGWIIYTLIYMSYNVSGSLWYDFRGSKPMFWVEMVSLFTVYTCLIIKYFTS